MIPSTASQQQQPAEKSRSIAWLNASLKSLHTLPIAEIFTWKKLSLNCLNTETFDRAHLRVKGKKKIHFFVLKGHFSFINFFLLEVFWVFLGFFDQLPLKNFTALGVSQRAKISRNLGSKLQKAGVKGS